MNRGWRDPGGNVAQVGMLHSFRSWNYMVGGRGVGKTAILVIRAVILALMFPGLVGMITEQTNRDIERILIPCWQLIAPKGGWKLEHKASGWQVRFNNGSVIYFASRHAKNTISDPPFHGMTVGWLAHDELSLDRRTDVIAVSGMMVRQEGMPNIVDICGTPRRNWLYSHCLSKGLVEPGKRTMVSPDGCSQVYYGPTAENQYNAGLHDRMIGEISDSEARQYLLGEWVDDEGLIWGNFSDEEWPDGNMIDDGGFRSGQGYVLSIDHGGNASWGLWQARGEGRFSRVAEYTPSKKQPGYRIAAEIEAEYGKPARIIAGSDHVTGGNMGVSAQQEFTSRGWCHTERVTGDIADKELQGNVLARNLCNTDGRRNILISRQMKCYYPGKTRGVLELFAGDTWPDDTSSTYFRKEKKASIFHEDTRDELLYFAVSMWRPTWSQYTNWAA